MFQTLKEWDRALLIWLNNIGQTSWDSVWLYITHIETWFVLFIFFFVLFFYYHGIRKGLTLTFFFILIVCITLFITNITKEYVARLRPNNVEALQGLIRVLQKPLSYSFFSGHASSGFAITTFVVLSLRAKIKLIYISYLWPFLFAFSRIYVGVHYPSDIIVGAAFGIIISFVFYELFKIIAKKL